MTTDELISRATQRLGGTGNPPLPPEETLKAIIQLGNERTAATQDKAELETKVAELEMRLEVALREREDAEVAQRQAEAATKEQAWVAHELGKFIEDIANGMFAGQEMAAAKRVYDLNSSSLTRKRLNAFDYDSLEEARNAYVRQLKGAEYSPMDFLEWLFLFSPHQ